MTYAFEPPACPTLETDDGTLYPVRRIFCVGRNYAAHAREMGHVPERGAPFYFTKSPHHLCQRATAVFPTETQDYHHEVELAVLIGGPAHGIDVTEAGRLAWGYACALDMTRRDLQGIAKDRRRPWDLGKDVEDSAIFGLVRRDFSPAAQRITLQVNGEVRQSGGLDELIHSVPELIADLSRFYQLDHGDVILTGTPSGVASVVASDRLVGRIDGLPTLDVTLISS